MAGLDVPELSDLIADEVVGDGARQRADGVAGVGEELVDAVVGEVGIAWRSRGAAFARCRAVG